MSFPKRMMQDRAKRRASARERAITGLELKTALAARSVCCSVSAWLSRHRVAVAITLMILAFLAANALETLYKQEQYRRAQFEGRAQASDAGACRAATTQ